MGRKFAAVVFSLGCLQASSALALGLGELKLQSFLNEPLKASVDLLNTAGMHEDEIKVRLGTREDFKRLGIDRAFFLTSIEFEVIKDDGGKARIVMTTDDPVIEPYLDFIIEARWPSGRLLREYTVLIDPPAFSTATPVVSASQRVEEVEGIPAPAKKKDAVAGKGTRVDVRKKSTLGPGEMPERDFNAAAAGSPAAGARYMIKRDDTLWTIASRAKPAGTSVHQTMLDIQRLNPDAFINNNINRVKAGYIIYLPTADDISSADLEAALTEVREQNAAWREGRDAERAARGPSLRIAVDSEDEEAPPPADAAVAKRESELTELEDDLDRSEMERADAQGRLAAMEDRVGTLERIVDLKDEQIAALQAALAEAQSQAAADPAAMADDTADALVDDVADDMAEAMPADAADELAEDVMQDVAEEPEAPAVMEQPVAEKPAAKPPAPAPEKSGGIMDYLWYIVGAAVLALLALLFLRRRGGDDDDYDADADDVFSNVQLGAQNLDVEEAVDSSAGDTAVTAIGTGAAAAAASGYSERGHDAYADDVEAADALAEADIYIAYGRHRQAVELLNNALANEPNNPVYRLKLMEIHTELNERAEASEQMHQLRSIGDQDSIARAEELMASFDAARAAPEAPQPAADAPAPGDEPGLAPNPLLAEDSGEMDTEFSGLAIEGSEEDADLDLSEDFTDDEEDELVIAADSNGMSTKLDLARAYIDMGDDDGARQILEEVVAEGSDELKSEAQQLLDRIG